jgi:hypothetical protein
MGIDFWVMPSPRNADAELRVWWYPPSSHRGQPPQDPASKFGRSLVGTSQLDVGSRAGGAANLFFPPQRAIHARRLGGW